MFSFTKHKHLIAEVLFPASIILAAMTLASYWVFLMPIFQPPDEDSHADYIFSLYCKKRLIRAAEAPLVACSNQYTRHLFEYTDAQAIKATGFARISPDYGTKNFFEKIDSSAPKEMLCMQSNSSPFIVAVYPAIYYAATAAWLRLLSCFDNHLTFLFFSARFLSVILLSFGLTFSYLTMKELKFSTLQASLLLAAIGFFPMVSSVASYIQPDNLGFAAVSVCFFLTLRWRNSIRNNRLVTKANQSPLTFNFSLINLLGSESRILWLLGLSMSFLLVKYQFFCCVGLPILAMVITTCMQLGVSFRRHMFILIVLLSSSFLIGIIQCWISWGGHLPTDSQHWNWCTTERIFRRVISKGQLAVINYIKMTLNVLNHSRYDPEGLEFKTFWGGFGAIRGSEVSIPLVICSSAVSHALSIIISWVTKFITLLTLFGIVKILIRLFNVAKKRDIRRTFYIVFSNPVINSFFLFVILMNVLYVIVYPTLPIQGRHWFPLILALFICATWFAPKVFSSRVIRRLIFYSIAFGWLCYSLIGSYAAIRCVEEYYSKAPPANINIQRLEKASINAPDFINYLEYLDRCSSFDIHPWHEKNVLVIPAGMDIWVQGWAADLKAEKLASAVFIFIDRTKIYQAIYGLKVEHMQGKVFKDKYCFSGFGAIIPTKNLGRGDHSLTMKFVSADGKFLYSTNQEIKIVVIN